MISKALFTSNSDEYETPQHIYDALNDEFGFDLDVSATDYNHKCPAYFTKEQDGLKQRWGGHTVWCNPPYSEINRWVQKAYEESRNENTTIVMLIPSRTDTKYFHNFIYHRAEIRFIKGRITFKNQKSHAPFPSMIVIFRGRIPE